MSILDKITRLATQKQREENETPGGQPFDWCVDYVIRRLPPEDFVELVAATIGFQELLEARMSSGKTVRTALAHDWVVNDVIDRLTK